VSEGFVHEPVLASEVVEVLCPRPGALVLDGTLGGGGHSGLLLERGARVIALDKDPRAIAAAHARLARFGEAFRAVRADFRDAKNVLTVLGIGGVDGALVDLGVSSPQLDEAERGFSFSRAGPLDMRMGDEGETLEDLLRRIDERELARILSEYGEEPFARPIARAVKRAMEGDEKLDTARLAEIIAGAIPRRAWPKRIHPATRTFQALRIAVNDELGALAAWLEGLPGLLNVGGRAAAISFHSLEDRRVKERFRALTQACTCPRDLPVCACGAQAGFAAVTRKAIKASDEEIARNPRARSARLRAVEKLR
jgi:16S rRNA (cytosine1402-N4)-methyltransferase